MADTIPRRKNKAENDKNIMSILLGDDAVGQASPHEPMVVDIENLVPFTDHPFKLYEGERLADMVRSIKELGVLLPAIVRPIDEDNYEILSGHNRINAAKIAGLTEIPVIIKTGLSDEEAKLIVTESNLVQRSFSDLSYSERAIALNMHLETLKAANGGQGKRTDILQEVERLSNPDGYRENSTSTQVGEKSFSVEKTGAKYGLSKNSVARYVRISFLIKPLQIRVDNEEIALIPAVSISYIPEFEQTALETVLSETSYKVDMKKAETLREQSARQHLTEKSIAQILSGEVDKKKTSTAPKPLTIKPKIYQRFFDEGTPQSEMEGIVEQALAEYFQNHNSKEDE